ncbi:MAG TPA: type IX secretion system membrane protein PorP/SprF [Bacteroidia bacterium]|jgi:type IX secretion system PorP/SprF family membrane protein|nr:type IX secretion system membrane protein PorP/SprF [Bacteroidia bacterium]
MRSIKYILTTLTLLLCIQVLKAQQLPQYSQFMLNDFSMNPAIAGTEPYFEAKSDNRYQWVGITDAPRTYMLTFDGPLNDKHIGIGSYIYTDITGPTRRTGFTTTYAYHMKLTSWLNASLGLSLGVLQFSVDGTSINLGEPGDPALTTNLESVFVPDIGFGGYLYGDNFYFGASVPQLVESQLKLTSFSDAQNILATHFYITGGYKMTINSNFMIEPTMVLKYVTPAPPQLDICAKVSYLKKIWLGAGFRTGDAVYALLGYTFQDNLTFGYSYDYPVTDIKKYTFGTNEIFIGIKFNRQPSPERKAKM